MIYSMTGFGRAKYEDANLRLSVEIKSLNHRFFEAAFYLPDGFGMFEEGLREKLSSRVRRGRIFFNLRYQSYKSEGADIVINKNLARKAVKNLKQLSSSLRIVNEVKISDIINLPNLVRVELRQEDKTFLGPKVFGLVDKAIADLTHMRCREGRALFKDINSRLKRMRQALQIISKESPRLVAKFQNKLKSFLKDNAYSQEKLIEEVSVFARNMDISEETVRLKSHIDNFIETLNNKTAEKGRALDFIAQEMQREANTIGAKSSSVRISQQVVVIKSEIEKIREQLSNVE